MDPFLGEIRLFAGSFAPNNWALCNGQILPISQYSALFSLLGTNFGGNGTTNFALPNYQGQTPIHWGQGPGLSQRTIGEADGETAVNLTLQTLPPHTHAAQAAASPSVPTPAASFWSWTGGRGAPTYYASDVPNTTMAPTAIAPTGGSQAHNNISPYVTLNFIIALQGIFPQRP
jgi:microcystin-dependent protein